MIYNVAESKVSGILVKCSISKIIKVLVGRERGCEKGIKALLSLCLSAGDYSGAGLRHYNQGTVAPLGCFSIARE